MERAGKPYWMRAAVCGAGLAVLFSAGAAQASMGAAVGDGNLNDGLHLRVLTDATGDAAGSGFAWITDAATVNEISLDCVDIATTIGPYPFPPYGPYSVLRASGTQSDGTRVYLTVADLGTAGQGRHDLVQIATTPGTQACGARTDTLKAVVDGDFVVTL